MFEGTQDNQIITSDGKPVFKIIEGVRIFNLKWQLDDRGGLIELFNNPDFFEDPIVNIHEVWINPGKVKGWISHHLQTDRLYFSRGNFKIVLYDGNIFNEFYFGLRSPVFLIIPPYIWHAVQNIGFEETSHISFPTKSYDYLNPDKYRIAPDGNIIPYRFESLGR